MKLTITPTKLAGGAVISGDVKTLRKIERLLTRTAIDSHCCHDNGLCMTLSRYFEKNNDTVDWVTLVFGLSALRNSLGYVLSKENHALMCMLEHLTFEALCRLLPKRREDIEVTINGLYGLNDYLIKNEAESRMVYLYILKDPDVRKDELLNILRSVSLTLRHLNKGYDASFKGLNRERLVYPYNEEFKYPL